MSKQLKPGVVFIDVGANVGYFTMLAASKGAHVLALEPNPRVAALLARSIDEENFANVVLLNQALSNEISSVTVAIPEGHSGGGSIVGGDSSGYALETLAVPLDVTLKGLKEFSSPTLVKIDAEGAELLILRGMRECLDRNPECHVVFEWDSLRFDEPEQRLNELRAWGFDLHVVLPTGDDQPISNDEIHAGGMQMLVLRRVQEDSPDGGALTVAEMEPEVLPQGHELPDALEMRPSGAAHPDDSHPYGHLWSVRLGFRHIPKTAGISLSLAIHEAWGLNYRSLLQVQDDPDQPILYRTPTVAAFRDLDLWRDRPFVSGHISTADLRLLGRTFLFTVLREPVERSLSAYVYVRRMAEAGSTELKDGELSAEQKLALQLSPSEWLGTMRLNVLTRSLLRGGTPTLLPSEEVDAWLDALKSHSESDIREVLRDCLSQFNVVYLGVDVRKIVENLYLQGLLPTMPGVPRLNVSEPTPGLGRMDYRAVFDHLNELTRVDQLAVDEAARMFPGYIYGDCLPNFERFSSVADRYGLANI